MEVNESVTTSKSLPVHVICKNCMALVPVTITTSATTSTNVIESHIGCINFNSYSEADCKEPDNGEQYGIH